MHDCIIICCSWNHLYRRPAVDRVDVLVHSVQEPQQELLGIVLSVPFELHRVFRHGVLKQTADHKCTKITAFQRHLLDGADMVLKGGRRAHTHPQEDAKSFYLEIPAVLRSVLKRPQRPHETRQLLSHFPFGQRTLLL